MKLKNCTKHLAPLGLAAFLALCSAPLTAHSSTDNPPVASGNDGAEKNEKQKEAEAQLRALLEAIMGPGSDDSDVCEPSKETAHSQKLFKKAGPDGMASLAKGPAPHEQDYEPSPAMWRLSDEDTTIYLFGTFHVLPDGLKWRTELFDQTLSEVDEIVFESREDLSPEQKAEERKALQQAIRDARGSEPISQRISPENKAKYRRLLRLAGLPFFSADRMPPILVLLGLGVASSEEEGSQRELGAETILEAEFAAAGKPISAIEDPVAVIKSLMAIEDARLITALDDGLDDWDGCFLTNPAEVSWESEHNWASGSLDEDFSEMLEDPFGKAIYEVLLVNRNRAWTGWLQERLKQPGNLMVAVGAGHMRGDDSVIRMLRDEGIEVTRLQ
ncbi:MAG: TraB/GumN family protein [Hyphomicrobiales bacterium]